MKFLYLLCLFQTFSASTEESDRKAKHCRYLDIYLGNKLYISCDSSSISYYNDYDFHVEVSIFLNNATDINHEESLFEFADRIVNMTDEVEINFHDFWNTTCITPFVNKLVNKSLTFKSAKIKPNWDSYIKSSIYCPWDNCTFYKEYEYVEAHFNQSFKNSNWRKICLENSGLLMYTENLKGEEIVISYPSAKKLLIGIGIGIAAMIISLLLIVCFCGYCISSGCCECCQCCIQADDLSLSEF